MIALSKNFLRSPCLIKQYNNSKRTIINIPIAKFYNPDSISFYPIKVPKIDKYIKNSTLKWRQLVVKNQYCPFVNSFGGKFIIIVERSNQASDWMRHVYTFLGNSELNTILIVLLELQLPSQEYSKYIFTNFPHQAIVPMIFGNEMFEFRKKMEITKIRKSNNNKNGVIIDIGFHHFFW